MSEHEKNLVANTLRHILFSLKWMGFYMYEVISYLEKEKWEEKTRQLKKQDIFYQYEYSKLYRNDEDGLPYLFYYENKTGNRLVYIFFKRKINQLSFIQGEIKEDFFDIITQPYGYGGPIYNSYDQRFLEQFRQVFSEYCLQENIICEFIRFHPLLNNHRGMEKFMDVSVDRQTVYIDLSKGEEEIPSYYHQNHRRNIKKAIKNKLEFKVFNLDEALEKADEFYEIYRETMDKLNASRYSYFSKMYIRDLLIGLKNKSLMAAVFLDGEMIAANLCLYEGGNLHFHLGCSKKDFQCLGANVYLLHRMALWGKENGLTRFHLGGGHGKHMGSGEWDALFQYKHRFNREGLLDFYIGKRVHNHEVYHRLVADWEKYYSQRASSDYVPAYRAMPEKKIEACLPRN